MIKEIREQEPFVHFGFNRQSIVANINESIIIWQDKIYLENQDFSILSSGVAEIEKSNNKIEIYYSTIGSKSLLIETLNGIKSNSLSIVIEPITWDSKNIFFNNEDITFNSL